MDAEGGPLTTAVSPLQMKCVVSFNQDYSWLVIANENYLKLIEVDGDEIYEEALSRPFARLFIAERLFSSNLIAFVSRDTPNTLRLYHFNQWTEICSKRYPHDILAVKLNRMRLIVATKESIHIHNLKDMSELKVLDGLKESMTSTVALSSSSLECTLAYAGDRGKLHIYNVVDMRDSALIKAHNSRITKIAYDSTGLKIATASRKGTVIRVFAVSSGQKLFEFRRGLRRYAAIADLAFSAQGCYLAVSSNTETIHIFRLGFFRNKREQSSESPSNGWANAFSKALTGVTNYLPAPATVLTEDRSFATVHLPCSGINTICGLTAARSLRVIIAGDDGLVRIYEIDKGSGGEGQLVLEQNFLADVGQETARGEKSVENLLAPTRSTVALNSGNASSR